MENTLTRPSDPGGPVAVRIFEQTDRSRSLEFRGEPLAALEAALTADISRFGAPIILAVDERLIFVDADCHHWETPPTRAHALATITAVHPRPVHSWATHGNGIRLVYIGEDRKDAEGRAAMAAMSLPPNLSVELKADSRHPRGPHPKRIGATCSEPIPEPLDTSRLSFTGTAADPEAVTRWREEHGMVVGARYAHDMCPIDPNHSTGAKPVAAYAEAVHCFSCAGRGVKFPGVRTAGHVTYAQLVGRGAELSQLAAMARRFVNWTHAKVVLRDRYPRASERVLETAYRTALVVSVRGDGDTRCWMALDRDLHVVRSHGVWLHGSDLTPIKLDAVLSALPWAYDAREVEREEGDPSTEPLFEPVLVKPRIDFLKAAPRLEAYIPIRPVRGVVLRPEVIEEGEEVVAVVPPRRGAPVELLRGRELLAHDVAYARLAFAFPGIDSVYLDALLAGAVCAEASGKPVMLQAVGPTGSGKGETIRLAASALGDEVLKLILDSESLEKFRRELGSAAASGRRYLVVDEVGKIRRLGTHMRALLEVSSDVSWRPLFCSADVLTPLRSMIVLAHLSVPEVLASAPEYCRRVRLARLLRTVPDWSRTCGGDTAAWRALSAENAVVLNSILTHAVALAARNNYDWNSVADELKLGRPDEGDGFQDEEALVRLYRHVCGRDGSRYRVTTGRFAKGRWIELTSRGAAFLFERLLSDDEEAIFLLRNRLESLDWGALLRIPEPAITCEVRHHGRQVVCRFRAIERVLRGRERVNEDLPVDHRNDVTRDPRASAPVEDFPSSASPTPGAPETASTPPSATPVSTKDLFAHLADLPDAPSSDGTR